MDKRHKDLLRNLVTQLRQTLIGTWDDAGRPVRGDLSRELERLGVATDGTLTPLDALSNVTTAERRARRVVDSQLASLTLEERPEARREIVERAGYTWINRLLALRTMEARGLIDETLRANPAYGGLSEALYILRQTQPGRTSGADGGWWAVVEDACRAQSEALPGLFDLDDPNAALRPSTTALLSCVALAGGGFAGFTVEESDAAFADPDAIGWAYQFYQEEAKARTYAKLRSGGKVETRSELAAVTQLFTEPYMVQWLLQNSLGRTYHELYPDSVLLETWEYYIRPDELPPQRAVGEAGPSALEELTLMDPCMGSGHFLREGFDMLAAMYRERQPGMGAREIADAVLSRHLHGIDIDPRAAQLAALTLYLRAWELIRDERRAQRLPGAWNYRPVALNLATTPTGLTAGALERHLDRHPEDRIFEPLLCGVFAALKQAPILGSLLQPSEHLDDAIRAFRRQTLGQYGLLPEHASLNRLLEELGAHDPMELKRVLMKRVAQSFAAEVTGADDVGSVLFGQEAHGGLRFLELLERHYATVVTNPPYMGSGSMLAPLAAYLKRHYGAGKRDLYSAFILRCLQMCSPGGRTAMVTMQSWMFLKSFADLRAVQENQLERTELAGEFLGILRQTVLEAIAHLGPYAFEEISGAVVNTALFTLHNRRPSRSSTLMAMRLIGLTNPGAKASMLRLNAGASTQGVVFRTRQCRFVAIPLSPVVYWLSEALLDTLSAGEALASFAEPLRGLDTCDMPRFVRFWWETLGRPGWRVYVNGGTYRKWTGLRKQTVDWSHSGARVKAFPRSIVPNEYKYDEPGLTFSDMCSGSFNCRFKEQADIFGVSGSAVFALTRPLSEVAGILNARTTSYILRALSPTPKFRTGYVRRLPYPGLGGPAGGLRLLPGVVDQCSRLKEPITSQDPTEIAFDEDALGANDGLPLAAVLHTLESFSEKVVFNAYALGSADSQAIVQETGVPSGWHPLVARYDCLPHPDQCPELSALPKEVFTYFETHERVQMPMDERKRLRRCLLRLYEAGPGARVEDSEERARPDSRNDEKTVRGAYIPIPAETFLEELSQKLQVHPVSVYWLLEELRAEGARCKPEERRILEDRLSVLVLRLLGHRWPRQIEAGEPAPDWADPDGILPLTSGTGETVLAELLRARLRAEDGPLSAQQAEALLQELTGLDLETWLRKSFFPRHVSQFKRRPIAWHLASTPLHGRGKVRRAPALECLLYYHACGSDVLARLRSHYVETLLYAERRQMERSRERGDETAAAQATERIHELEEFASRLRQVESEGFACPELEVYVHQEPLDRWSGDGVFSPGTPAEFLAQEEAWNVDINDGVRVNITPLQRADLLAGKVLSAKDMRRAIADRARWRSDERRWVREGVLPRCGWMDESVPESPRWTERAPEREAERQRLEEKRRALTEKLEGMRDAAE